MTDRRETPEGLPAWLEQAAREREIKQMIEEAAEKAVERLKKSGMVKRRQMSAIQKTEELLRL